MQRVLFLCAAALIALPALALEKTFSWDAPTQYEDGSALPAAEIAGYTITCGALVLTVAGPVTSFRADFGPGSYTCSAQTRATNGQTSSASNAVSFTVPQSVPNAPVDFSVD
jgi:hypothetical protein